MIKTLPPVAKRALLRQRDTLIDGVIKVRQIAGRKGGLPQFIIIGGQKCGTTFLYDRLNQHPDVRPCLFDALNDGEIHYFHRRFCEGPDWYRAFFPSQNGHDSAPVFSGEASGYIYYPHAPARIRALIPDARLIALLRNPVDRAYSHYQHEARLGFESLSFAEAIDREPERLTGEYERVKADPSYFSFNRNHFSYLERGIYADQLPWWWEVFPKEHLMIVQSEQLYREPQATLQSITEFTGLPSWTPPPYSGHKSYGYEKLDDALRQSLRKFFKPHNERLFNMLGVDYGWNDNAAGA